MKLATWNVNGIRARQAELQAFIEREAPDVLCLQEIKAGVDQLPVWVCELEGYWCYWHGGKGYSGVGLHVRKEWHPDRPLFHHPEFDYEHRIVTAQLPQATIRVHLRPERGQGLSREDAFPRGDGCVRGAVSGFRAVRSCCAAI
jgi:exodeoxyribonuclease-3